MDNPTSTHTLDSPPQLYALYREEGECGPPGVVAWGMAFVDGRTFTLWTDPDSGESTLSSSLVLLEGFFAPCVGADVVWLTGPLSTG